MQTVKQALKSIEEQSGRVRESRVRISGINKNNINDTFTELYYDGDPEEVYVYLLELEALFVGRSSRYDCPVIEIPFTVSIPNGYGEQPVYDNNGNVIEYACVHWYDDFGRCKCCGAVKYDSYAYRELYGGE